VNDDDGTGLIAVVVAAFYGLLFGVGLTTLVWWLW
jgi:hypothetical protein